MRRAVSLLLTAVLLLGLASGALAADTEAFRFSDWAQIKRQGEVAMLTDLGLVSGYADGTFRPKNSITRAEIAKIIAGLLTEEKLEDGPALFTDTEGSWASPYINYCAERGVVSGGAGKLFRPNDDITARELAKMLLIVLGWDAGGYTGASWAETVDADAGTAGLYESYQGDRARAVTREEACLLIGNALQSGVVVGRDETGAPQYLLDDMMSPKSLLEERFEIVPIVGVVEANAVADLRTAGERLDDGLLHISGYTKDFVVSSRVSQDASLLGHCVTIYASFGTSANRVYGTPTVRAGELAVTLSESREFETILNYQGLVLTEETRYFRNFQPCESDCIAEMEKGDVVNVIDHEGDNKVDMVLVMSPE